MKPKNLIHLTPTTSLLSFLRANGLTGTKLGCNEGGCGACTVILQKWTGKVVESRSVNACLFPAVGAEGGNVVTVEGLGSLRGGMHPVQERMTKSHGSQCGFCTPGIVVAMSAIFVNNPDATVDEVEEHMDGNICRCTGYRPIWDTAKSLCSDAKKGPCGESCNSCPEQNDCDIEHLIPDPGCCTTNNFNSKVKPSCNVSSSSADKFKKDPVFSKSFNELDYAGIPFPEELKVKNVTTPFKILKDDVTWYDPRTLEELLELKKSYPEGRIVVGNSEVGIEQKFKNMKYKVLIGGCNISALKGISETDSNFVFGANTPLNDIAHSCEASAGSTPGSTPFAIHNMLRWFASTQIRNTASLAGNLATASPISDMNPLLAATDSTMKVQSKTNGARFIKVNEFFLSYRKTALQSDEVIVDVTVPKTGEFEFVFPFKQAKRREDDISIVTSAMRVKLEVAQDKSGFVVAESAFAFGGMDAKTVAAPLTSAFLKSKPWSLKTLNEAKSTLFKDLPLPDDVPGGQPEYRRSLAASFLYKFFVSVCVQLETVAGGVPVEAIDDREKSAALSFVTSRKPTMIGTQRYPKPKITPGLEDGTDDMPMKCPPVSKMAMTKDAVGKGSTHQSGALHCTGEAKYTDDIGLPVNGLEGCLIHSTVAGCDIKSIDASAAEKMEGVVKVVLYKDLVDTGGNNKLGPIMKDEEVFGTKRVRHVGMVLGLVMADSLEVAQEAARAVKVEYENHDDNVIVSIDEAIKAGSFYPTTDHTIESGDVKAALETPGAVTVEGTFRIGGQEHFYLECNTTMCVPKEGGMVVHTSSQAPTKTQMFCASAAGIPANKVVCKMKRMGGGFGGKETRSVFVAAACAVGAKIVNRPVRVTLDRNVDMQTTGQRHAFVANYKAAAIMEGGKPKLLAMDVNMYSNGGCSLDLSGPVMDRSLFHLDGAYKWQALKVHGLVCKTHQPPHTAYRGFGGPQGIVAVEHVVDRLATKMGVDVTDLREANLYKEGDATHFGQTIEDGTWNVPRSFSDVKSQSGIEERKKEVSEFNAANKWKKRGLAYIPTKFGIAFTAKFMNQGGALVHVYQDGTVLVNHGGTEMGQGLHTKVCQVAAQAFGISSDEVFVDDSDTSKVANTQPTAASMSTDMYGMATLDACRQILKRLQPFREKLGEDASLAAVATAAFFERVDLSAHGFYALSDARCGYNWDAVADGSETGPDNSFRGHPFNYFTQGSCFSMVEVDLLTGDHSIVRSDVVMDVGSSINPAIDIGQIEGAFVQGVGWSTVEELIWGDEEHKWVRPRGRLFTQGPGFYKPPAFNDMPAEFNVTLMDGVANKFAVMSSKAIGEPPFAMGIAVFFAIKDALGKAREEQGVEDEFVLMHPATSERIRMAVGDKIVAEGGGGGSWQAKGSY
ncbi:hypothetical protein TL16_g07465 [Triparma laevis f. inornata]|uniref:Xanthine dehydrogenase n=1 Tax=Triparma laevis f. inornata TaxID=1714386 RepID=A0A9W7ASL8_9STRA|nr:hypothetical protein TL16_g07465 [Triparma laevis f. inornata]